MENLKENMLLLITMVALLFSTKSIATPVSVNITGNVLAAPCTFDTINSQLSVPLGDTLATNLATASSASNHTSFKLVLKDCPVSTTKVTATFDGPLNADLAGGNSYASTGTAKGVSVKVKFDADMWASGAFGKNTQKTVNVAADHTATFPLWAAMYSPSGGATPGTVNTTMTATFTYQ